MRKLKYCLLGALCACLTLGVAVGCGDNDDDQKTSDNPKEVMLADFEKWAPDFQTIRLRNEFGSVDVNTDSAYVKSGKQSAALTVVGADGAEKPLFFVNTVSGHFDYDYSDFSKIDSVSAWLYNASQTDETVYVGLITSIVSIEQVGYEKYETFTLKSGWNEVVYKPDMNYVISAVGQEEYDGIKGVYFMFDNPHAATKAEGKKFYVDDVKLNYGKEKPYSEVRAGKYYTSGTQIGAPSYITLKNPVTMKELEEKALSFEFKFDSDTGRFGFAIMCDDYNWNNITGTLIIEKTADGIVANMGRIEALEDGWYVWKLNHEFFAGDGASRAESVSLIYHQGEVVQGNVIINWNSMKAVGAYEPTREESAEKFTDGGKMFHYFYEKGIPMSELKGKALQFEFKFVSDTGKFGFTFMDDKRDWANITGELVIEKTADGVVSNLGKIEALEDGWYAWKLNSDLFAGNGATRAEIADLAFTNNDSVIGTVYLDWSSLKAVDAYTVTREERAEQFTDGNKIEHNFRDSKIPMTDLQNKALSFEFKFATETGKFGFNLEDMNGEWKSITGDLIIKKTSKGVSANMGVVTAIADGWYQWKLNRNLFAGHNVANAESVNLAYHYDIEVEGTVYVDWNSFNAVDAYSIENENLDDSYFDGFEGTGNGCVLRVKDWTETELSNAEKRSGAQSFKIHVRKNNSSVVLKLDTDMIAAMINPSQLTLWVNIASGTCGNLIGSVYKESDGDYLGSRATVEAGENGTWRKITFSAEQVQEIKTIGAITLYFDFGSDGSGVAYVDDLELKVTDPDVQMGFENKTARYESGTKVELADFANTEKFAGVEFNKLAIICNGEIVTCSFENNKMFFAPDEAGRYVFEYTHVDGHKIAKATQVITLYTPLTDSCFDGFEGTGNASVIKTLNGATTELSKEEKHSGNQSLKVSVTAGYDSIVIQLDTDMIAAMTGSSQLSLWVYGAEGSCGQIIVSDYNSEDGWKLGGNRVTWSAVENGSWHKITFSVGQTAAIKSVGAITLCCDGTTNFVAYVDDIEITEQKTIVMDFETGDEEMVTRSYADTRISTVEISEEQANSGTKSIKVFQNQYGALVLKLSQEMIDAIDDSSTLTIRYMIASSDKDQTTAWMNFFSATAPNSETDKQETGYLDCKISEGGVDSGSVPINTEWKSKEISGELLASIKENGYLWMNVSVTDNATYTFYVDNITLA